MVARLPVIALAGALLAATSISPAAADGGTLEKIRASGAIVMGYRESSYPLSYLDDRQQPIGYHIDVCNRIVDAVRARLGMPGLAVRLQPVTSQNRVPLMVNGTTDIECGSTTNNEARARQVAFAPTTFVTHVRIAVKTSSGITGLAQLDGKPVVTTSGTTSVQLLRAHERGKTLNIKEVFGKDHADFLPDAADRPRRRLHPRRQPAGRADRHLEVAGRLRHRRRDAQRRADRHHAAPRRSRLQGAGRRHRRQPDEERRTRPTLRQVVRIANSPRGINMNFPMSAELKHLIEAPNDLPAEAYTK